MTLEQQIETLAELGFHLNEGVTIDDLLYSMPREEYEQRPFHLILFLYGGEVEREPWGRWICSKVWHFDTECIEKTGDYVKIIRALCRISGRTERITNIVDFVDLESDTAWLEYTINGERRHWTIEVNDDWADTLTLAYVREDIVDQDHRFYSMDGGQSMLLFYLDQQTATALNRLTKNALENIDF
jgi:ADP-ribose pyrophosphatase YjhB (NUDIX family)